MLPNSPELEQPGVPLLVGHTLEPAGDLERPLEVHGGVGVRVDRAGAVGRLQRIPPCALVVARPPEVLGEHLGVECRVCRHALERLARRLVDLGTCPVRECLVHHVADEAVAEPQASLAVGLEEAVELLPRRFIELTILCGQRGIEHGATEAAPEHRCDAQCPPCQRRDRVDLSGDDGVDRIGNGVERAGEEGRPSPLFDELRAARRLRDDAVELVRASGGCVGRGDRQATDHAVTERHQVDPLTGIGHEAALAVAAQHDDQPRPIDRRCDDAAEDVGCCLVGPLRVLETDDQRSAVDSAEQVDDEIPPFDSAGARSRLLRLRALVAAPHG